MKENTTLAHWLQGIDYEVAFWKNLYRRSASREWILHSCTLGHDICLHNFDAGTFLRGLDAGALVLDVGCGMSYYTGNKLDGHDINIHYIDPLAPFYNNILNRYAPDAPRITFGMMEYLSAFYPKQDVSLVIIQNALDHSANPIKGIMEAMEVLHIGGTLYLKHYPNEAEKEQYRGFHQHNIDIQNGHLVVWNKEGMSDVNALLQGFATIEVSRYDSPGEVIAVIRKTADVPTSMLSPKQDISQLCAQLIAQAQLMSSPGYAIRRSVKRNIINVGQYMARFLSYDTKNKIKAIARKLFG